MEIYWVMLFGPAGSKSGCPEGTETYAQDGWLVGGDYVPHHFYEIAKKTTCDSGPILEQSARYGTTHTYEVWLSNQYASPTVDFYMDGTYETGAVLDWSWPDTASLQVSAETEEQENRVGGESFTSLQYCTVPGGSNNCNPNTSMSSSCGNSQGCLPPSNPYGCYLSTGASSFNVYDSRGNGGHC